MLSEGGVDENKFHATTSNTAKKQPGAKKYYSSL